MKKPNFICIGAPKAGTTTIYRILRDHPQVFVSEPKEPYFFSSDLVFEQGYDWYWKLFENASNKHVAIGEFSVTYCFVTVQPIILDRMRRVLDDLRILFMVRDPIKRIESHWLELRLGAMRVTESFDRSLEKYSGLISGSLYNSTYQLYADAYGAENIKVIALEDYHNRPEKYLDECCRFLGVDPLLLPGDLSLRANVWEDKVEDGWLANNLRSLRLLSVLKDALPWTIRKWLRRTLTKPVKHKPRWRRKSYDRVIDRLQDEAAGILQTVGLPENFWSLEPSEPFINE